jgi:hypothetical protein
MTLAKAEAKMKLHLKYRRHLRSSKYFYSIGHWSKHPSLSHLGDVIDDLLVDLFSGHDEEKPFKVVRSNLIEDDFDVERVVQPGVRVIKLFCFIT